MMAAYLWEVCGYSFHEIISSSKETIAVDGENISAINFSPDPVKRH